MNSPPASSPVLLETAPAVPAAEFGEELDGRHSGDFLRLQRLLEHGEGFQLVFAACLSVAYRRLLIERIDTLHPSAAALDLPSSSEPSALLNGARQIGQEHELIHVFGIEPWLRHAGPEALRALNYRRETLAADAASTLVLWVEPGTIPTFATEAPDLWAWRAAVLDFAHPLPQRVAVHEQAIFLGSAERARREQRLGEINDYLMTIGEPAGYDAGLLLEASEIERSLGQFGLARDRATAASLIFRRLDDRFGEALAAGHIADILEVRGELDEALRIRQEEELPVYERLGDVREKAVTMGKIADILHARGQLDEALRTRQDEELPVYERLGDVRGLLVCRANIALTLLARKRSEDRAPANALLCLGLADARRLRIPEAGQIEEILQNHGMSCP